MNPVVRKLLLHPIALPAIGFAVWILPMLIATGGDGINALLNAAGFLVAMFALTTGTRTLSVRTPISMFLLGGGMMGLALVFAWINSVLFGSGPLRLILQPPIEQVLFMLPPLLVLWRWRQGTLWSLGACDILLMFAACGAGFGMVEEAYIRHKASWQSAIPFIPIIELAGDRIRGYHVANGHAVWASLAGAGIGIAHIMRSKKQLAIIIAAVGVAVGVIDHLALNITAASSTGSEFLMFLVGNGYIATLVFVVATVVAIFVDWQILYGKNRPTWIPKEPRGKQFTPAGWAARLDLRSAVFAAYFIQQVADANKWMPQRMVLFLMERLVIRNNPKLLAQTEPTA